MEDLDTGLRAILLALARNAIIEALDTQRRGRMKPESHPRLDERRAAFVTLKAAGQLRGCIGTLEAREPLASVVYDCAVGAALRDPRFPAVTARELDEITISISVLAEPRPLPVVDRDHLLAQLRPGSDGLVVHAGRRHATFLPQVWEQLPDPASFVEQLLHKAGLPAGHWPTDIRFQRYHSVSFSEPLPHSRGPSGPR
jgi:AmmeMemoRadiSam system protein A